MSKCTLLIGFGSNKPGNQRRMLDVASKLSAEGNDVRYAYIGGDEPTISSAMKKIREDGITECTVIPFLTATGEMTTRYIPRHLGIEESYGTYNIETGSCSKINYLKAVGELPEIADIIDDMVSELDVEDDSTGIMLITYGSQLRYNSLMAQAHVDALMAKGHAHVLTAFLDYNEPTIEDCETFMIRRGAEKIIAVPVMIAENGEDVDRIPEGLGIAKGTDFGTINVSGRDVDIYLTKAVGENDAIVGVIRKMAGL